MFDNPGKRLNQLKGELLAVEEDDSENIAVDFDDVMYEEETFDEGDAVFVSEPRHAGLKTLVLLLLILGGLAAARWWLGWL